MAEESNEFPMKNEWVRKTSRRNDCANGRGRADTARGPTDRLDTANAERIRAGNNTW